ncbi:MAG: hypothetical protein IJV70_07355 [Clostridia bacterium]|nr:hypothetical protein [Clostridia bacterium]
MQNPRLYLKLQELFGEVRVARAGETGVPPEVYKDPVTGKWFTRYVTGMNHGEEYHVCCPFCQDTGFHLYINHQYGLSDPYGNAIRLANCYHRCLEKPENRNRLFQDVAVAYRTQPVNMALAKKLQKTPPPAVVRPVPVLENVRLLSDLPPEHSANQYLLSRGFDLSIAKTFQLGYYENERASSVIEKMANGRLIIPICQDHVQVGWQARKISDSARGPKYFTSPGLSVGSVLYNFDAARKGAYVVLTEGVADVWRIGDPAVCLFGKALSLGQKSLILKELSGKKIVVMLDRDAEADGNRIVQQLRNAGAADVQFLGIPEGYNDPGETPPYMLETFIKEKLYGKSSDSGTGL